MAIKGNDLKNFVDKLGPQYRNRIQRAVLFEQERAFGRALEEWETLLAEARKDGKDVSMIQKRVLRIHKLYWQKERPHSKEPPPTFSQVEEEGPSREREDTRARAQEPPEERAGLPDTDRGKQYQKLKTKLKMELQSRCLAQGISLSFRSQENRLLVRGLLDRLFKERLAEIPDWVKRRDLLESIVDDVLGLGLLEGYLRDPSVSEVMVNGVDIYYEKQGKIYSSQETFKSNDEVREVIDRIVQPIGRRVDESSPMVDARLPDGARVNIIIPPLALDGPVITVRKFPEFRFSEDILVQNGTLSRPMAVFLGLLVRERENVMIAGRTSSGKTTILNLLGNAIPGEERIVTIEDVAELRLPQRHLIRLEARPPNLQGTGEVPIRTLFRNALHMRPDRIIVGECRGTETMDMLQAMNTGHDGSLSTAHANSPWDLFARLEAMVSLSELQVSPETVRLQIAAGIDTVIFCSRLSDGQRKVTSVCEVLKGGSAEETIQVEEIFRFERTGVDGEGLILGNFLATGYIPTFVKENPDLSRNQDVLALFQGE